MFYRHNDIRITLESKSPNTDELLEEIVAKLEADGKACRIIKRGKAPLIEVDGENYWAEFQERFDNDENQTAILKLD